MGYTYLEDITIADAAFRAEGQTLPELFTWAALALTNVMVRTLDRVEPKVEHEIILQADDVERLLYDFLQELIFLKDAELLLFSRYEVSIRTLPEGYQLQAKAYGEPLSIQKHDLVVDVKAVTMHRYEVTQTSTGWEATVVLDI